jgi:hypothetical protein
MNEFLGNETYIDDPMDISDDDKERTNVIDNEKIIGHFEEALFELEYEGEHEEEHERENDPIGENEGENEEENKYLETRRYLVAPRTKSNVSHSINIYDVNDYKINPLNI